MKKVPLIIILFIFLIQAIKPQSLAFKRTSFSTSDNVLRLAGNSYCYNSSLFLTNNNKQQSGGIFIRKKIHKNAGFSTLLKFKIYGQVASGADGIVFVITSDSSVLTSALSLGGGMGYQGIKQSVGIEFDSYINNSNTWEDMSSHLAVNVNGADITNTEPLQYVDLSKANPVINFNIDDNLIIYSCWIDYDEYKKLLEIRLTNNSTKPSSPTLSCNIDFDKYVEDSYYLGFTSATGNECEFHEIKEWYFSSSLIPGGIDASKNYTETNDLLPPSKPFCCVTCDSIKLSNSVDDITGVDHYEYQFVYPASSVPDNTKWIKGKSGTKMSDKFDKNSYKFPLKVFYRVLDKAGNISNAYSLTL